MKRLTIPALSHHIPGASVNDRVTGKLRAEVRGVEYPQSVSPSTPAIGSDFDGAGRIFFIDEAFFPRRVFESELVWPIIPLSDSLFLPIIGKEAGGHRLV